MIRRFSFVRAKRKLFLAANPSEATKQTRQPAAAKRTGVSL